MRTHTHTQSLSPLSIGFCIYLSIHLPTCLYTCLFLSINLSVYQSICPSIYLSLSLSLSRAWGSIKTPGQTAHPQVLLQAKVSIYLSLSLSLSLSLPGMGVGQALALFALLCLGVELQAGLAARAVALLHPTFCLDGLGCTLNSCVKVRWSVVPVGAGDRLAGAPTVHCPALL